MTYTVLDFAEDVLKQCKQPLVYQDIWEAGSNTEFARKLNLKGKTPWQTLGARLYVDVRDKPTSKFMRIGKNPVRFWLRSRAKELPPDILERLAEDERKPQDTKTKSSFSERDLHPFLAYFAYSNPSFNRGRSVLTKTIYHEKSKNKAAGLSEWIHPDMVGFYLPLEDWNEHLIEFNRIAENNALRLFSFEIKKSIDRSNYRESFFQAVSNSSWANEGYLVSANIKQDDDLHAELERLANSFGIGLIQLDLADPDSSSVLFPARLKTVLDWETMNKLCEQNIDFSQFIQNVKIDFQSKKIHSSEYDKVEDEIEKYIAQLLK